MLLLAAGMAGLARLEAASGYSSIWPCFLLCGVGTALTMPTVSATAMGAIASQKAGVASGVLNTARQVGGALGIAVVSAVAAARITAHWNDFVATVPAALRAPAARLGDLADGGQLEPIGRVAGPAARHAAESAFMAGFAAAMWTAAALAVVAAVVALVGLRGAPAPAGEPSRMTDLHKLRMALGRHASPPKPRSRRASRGSRSFAALVADLATGTAEAQGSAGSRTASIAERR
jgi:sugar phosphate permease